MPPVIVYMIAILAFSFDCRASSGIPADELFRNPDILGMSLSPNGELLLEVGLNEEKRVLNLFQVEPFMKYKILDEHISKSNRVTDYTWLSDSRLYIKEKNSAFIVKIDSNSGPLKVNWFKIPVNGYIVSSKVDSDGNVVFAKEIDGYYSLFKASIDELLEGEIGFFKSYRAGLSEAVLFSMDEKTETLLGVTYEDDDVQTWYLPRNKSSWSRLYKHETKESFEPITFIDQATIAVLTNENSNFTYLSAYCLKTGEFTKTLYQHPSHDLIDASLDSEGNLHSVSYIQHGIRQSEYFSSTVKSVHKKLLAQIVDRKLAVVDTSDNGQINLIYAHASNSPGKYYAYNNQKNKLYNLGLVRKNLNTYSLAKAEVINVKLDGGPTVEGIVTNPVGKSNGVLLVNPHGGPIGVRDYANFNLENQFYASRGYTILNVNFRGSSGFGKRFQNQGVGQFGQLIEQDIMSVYQEFIKQNNFDYKCTMGASYGGYSAFMLAIKYPKEFQCVISTFGVYDLPHLFSATNFSTSKENHMALKNVMGDDIQNLRDISPVYLADNLEVPILIMAGRTDSTAPFEQSNRMKYVLNKLGKDVHFHVYESTGHGHQSWIGDRHQHNATHQFIQNTRSNFYHIVKAIQLQDIDVVEDLINSSIDLNTQDIKGFSLLHHAIQSEDELFSTKVVQLLLQLGANIEIKDEDDRTPLFSAVFLQKRSLVKLLLTSGADVNTTNKALWTPISTAASLGDIEIAKELLNYDVDLTLADSKGWEPLMFTTNIRYIVDDVNQAEIAKLLLKSGSNIETKRKSGVTVLMNAVLSNKLNVIKVLVESGANLYATNSKSGYKNVMDYALGKGNEEILEYLSLKMKKTNHFNDLIEFIESNDVNNALKQIPKLPNINAIDNEGRTAAQYALSMENAEDRIKVLQALIINGIDINQQDKEYRSPLFIAITLEQVQTVHFLVNNGADINLTGYKEWRPLSKAISQGNVEMVKSMSDFSMNLTSRTFLSGWSAFIFITDSLNGGEDVDQAKVGKILLEHGADIEVRTRSGRTTLMSAAANEKFEVLKMLLAAGADINARNSKDQNKTALDYAIEEGHDEIVDYLTSHIKP